MLEATALPTEVPLIVTYRPSVDVPVVGSARPIVGLLPLSSLPFHVAYLDVLVVMLSLTA